MTEENQAVLNDNELKPELEKVQADISEAESEVSEASEVSELVLHDVTPLELSKGKLYRLVDDATRFEEADIQAESGSQGSHCFYVCEEYELISRTIVRAITGKTRLAENTITCTSPAESAQQEADSHVPELIEEIVAKYQGEKGRFYGQSTDEHSVLKLTQEYSHLESCGVCNAAGQILCSVCDGKAKFTCSNCSGSCMQQCTNCFGGRTICNICNGVGSTGRTVYHSNNTSSYVTSPCSCYGGRVICNTCNGASRVSCRTCYGTGKTPCGGCAGRGRNDCYGCEASGQVGNAASGEIVGEVRRGLLLEDGMPDDVATAFLEREGALRLPKIAEQFSLREIPTVSANKVRAVFDGSVVVCRFEVLAIGERFNIATYGSKTQWLSLDGLIERLLDADLKALRRVALDAHSAGMFSIDPLILLEGLRHPMASEINVAILEAAATDKPQLLLGAGEVPICSEYASEIKSAVLGVASLALFRRAKYWALWGLGIGAFISIILGLIWGIFVAMSGSLVMLGAMLWWQTHDAKKLMDQFMHADQATRLLRHMNHENRLNAPRLLASLPGFMVAVALPLIFHASFPHDSAKFWQVAGNSINESESSSDTAGYSQDLNKLIALAEQGNAEAQEDLGVKYLRGDGVPKDPKRAFEWIGKSARNHYPAAQRDLGTIYYDGVVVEKNIESAIRWWFLSAEAGDAIAQENMGIMLMNGLGVPKDIVSAYMWLSLAKEKGNQDGNQYLAQLASKMNRAQIQSANQMKAEWLSRHN